MSSWTLGARSAEKAPEKGIVAIDLTIDGGSPITLDSDESERLVTALGKALAGIDNASGQISCVNAGNQIVIRVDKTTIAALRYDKAELMRSQLKELLAGNATEFSG
ncbi:hypothetical protein [Nitrobacter hamburgensis]|uniref:hypothetical protein n=1 Tax=Nitrobacter hamburgensis TaxID=912 RepID=UPI00059D803F|nr:hypothetical protein [Nitrobacter hamburgensis]